MTARRALLLCLAAWVALAPLGRADPPPLEKQAEAARKAGELEEALALYRRLLAGAERDEDRAAEGRYNGKLADVYASLGDRAANKQALDQAIRHYQGSLRHRQAISVERRLFRCEMRLEAERLATQLKARAATLDAEARTLLEAGKIGEALKTLRQAQELAPQPKRNARLAHLNLRWLRHVEAEEARRALARARAAAEAGRWRAAVDAFEEAGSLRTLDLDTQRELLTARRKLATNEMVRIPAGEVTLGSDGGASDEQPRHRRKLPAFYIDRYEVSNEAYARFVHATGHRVPRTWRGPRPPEGEELLPVRGVSWHDAVAYARWAGKRLPTEAEWVRAARGDTTAAYPWGQDLIADAAAAMTLGAKTGARGPVARGSFPLGKSPFGVHDLLGNVLEWTASPYAPYPGAGWRAPGATHYVLRGGAWYVPQSRLRIATRFHDVPASDFAGYGFRCAMSVPRD